MTPQRVAVRWIDGEAQGRTVRLRCPAGERPTHRRRAAPARGVRSERRHPNPWPGGSRSAGTRCWRRTCTGADPTRLAGYDERAKAIAMLKTLPDGQVLDDIERGLDLLDRETGGAALGVVGLRIGGRYGPAGPRHVSRVGSGPRSPTTAPGSTAAPSRRSGPLNAIEQVQALRTPMLLIFVGDESHRAGRPRWIRSTPRLRRGGADYEIVRYPGREARIRVPRPRHLSRGRGRGCLEPAARVPWSAIWEEARAARLDRVGSDRVA